MDAQQLTIVLFAVGQLVMICLAIGGWVSAVRMTRSQLQRQHEDSLRLDEERIRREMILRAVMELIQRLYDLSAAGSKVAGTIGGTQIILPTLLKDHDARVVFVRHMLPEFNRAWEEILDIGLRFIVAFDTYEPIVHWLIPERDKLFAVLGKATACRVGPASAFTDLASRWLVGPQVSQESDELASALEICRAEFSSIQTELNDAITAIRVILQNESLAPIFGHEVDPHRKSQLRRSSRS